MTDRCEPPPELRGVDGWHWVHCISKPQPELLQWCGKRTRWEDDEGDEVFLLQGRWRYLSPVATPAEVEALRAERDARRQQYEDDMHAAIVEVGKWSMRAGNLDAENTTLRARVAELEAALQAVVDAWGDKTWGTVYAMERALPAARAALSPTSE